MLCCMSLQGVPTTVDVKGLQLNTSMDGDPGVTAEQLIVQVSSRL